MSGDEFLTTKALAAKTGTSEVFWNMARCKGGKHTPPFFRVGRNIRYRWSDVQAWLDARQHKSTSEYPNQAA